MIWLHRTRKITQDLIKAEAEYKIARKRLHAYTSLQHTPETEPVPQDGEQTQDTEPVPQDYGRPQKKVNIQIEYEEWRWRK